MAIKIIHILHHSPSWITRNIEEDIFDGWHVRTAKAIQDLAIKNCKIECWLPEKTKFKERQIEKDAITYRVFPSFPINYGREISLPLIKALKEELSNPILLHIHGIFNYTTYLIAAFFPSAPIISQHYGDCPPLNLIQRRAKLFTIFPLLITEQLIAQKIFKNIGFFFCLTKTAQDSLKRMGVKNNVTLKDIGIDLNMFTPGEKNEARKVLNLPLDSKIILHVGKLNRYKGGDSVISAFNKLKEKYDISCVIVGASQSDELYKQAINNGVIVFPRQPHNNLNLFYRAADVYVYPGNKTVNAWAGIGVSTCEAIACNTPVVSATLLHFPDDYKKVGFYATNTEEIVERVDYIFQHQEEFINGQKIAQKYYNWENIASSTYRIYQQLFYKYYKIKLER